MERSQRPGGKAVPGAMGKSVLLGPRGDIPALWHAVLTQTDLEPGTAGPYSSCLETLFVAA